MKFRIPFRFVLRYTNPNRNFFGYALFGGCVDSFFLSYSYFRRRELRIFTEILARKRSICIFYLCIHTYSKRFILRKLFKIPSVSIRYFYFLDYDVNRFHRLCITLRTNVLLRGNSDNKLCFGYPLYRE